MPQPLSRWARCCLTLDDGIAGNPVDPSEAFSELARRVEEDPLLLADYLGPGRESSGSLPWKSFMS
jgi:hypothetical protein